MPGRIDARLAELGITLPEPAKPLANYVPFTISARHVFVSGQGGMLNGRPRWPGKVGLTVGMEDGALSAQLAFINVLAQLRVACGGDLDRVEQVVRLGGFVACGADFTQHGIVMNGASDLAVALFGEAGRHARTTVGVPSLPLDLSVEVEGLFRIA
ncbi:MAG: RidA family protein [Alphaproteobacteria bacterium]|nr:RidA family protein [Alphaproteobacteria bacterium]